MVLGGILAWGAILYLLLRRVFDKLSGWNGLAALYRAPCPPPVWHWKHQTVKVGAVRYRRSMHVAAPPEGLWLAEAGLLRHPVLFIPWSELRNPAETRFYGRRAVRLEAGPGTVELPTELYNAAMLLRRQAPAFHAGPASLTNL